MSAHFDTLIIGGGAAGLMCAITAGRRGKRSFLTRPSTSGSIPSRQLANTIPVRRAPLIEVAGR